MPCCSDCGAAFGAATTCTRTVLAFGPYTDARVRFGDEFACDPETPANCAYCGVQRGGVHHAGCAAEECPNCGDHLMQCRCPDAW